MASKAKTVKATRAAILVATQASNPVGRKGFDGMRAPEMAAWLGLDEMLTFKAIDKLAREGLVKDLGDVGVFFQWHGGRWSLDHILTQIAAARAA